jgi:GntR family transcriptional regulator
MYMHRRTAAVAAGLDMNAPGIEMDGHKLPIRLSQATGVPYYRQIVDQVAALVRSGQLPPQTRLPSYRELAPQLLVSLITVRRAYADLEAAGLIVLRQGQGAFVAEEIETSSRRQALAEARALIEDAFARAEQLGLRGEALRATVARLIDREAGTAGRATPEKGQAHGRE